MKRLDRGEPSTTTASTMHCLLLPTALLVLYVCKIQAFALSKSHMEILLQRYTSFFFSDCLFFFLYRMVVFITDDGEHLLIFCRHAKLIHTMNSFLLFSPIIHMFVTVEEATHS